MALISGNIPNLFSGVSQQAPALRLPTQAEEMDNFYPSLVDGLVKRPPVKDITRIGTRAENFKTKLHVINRDTQNRFILVLHGPDIYVHKPDGTRVFHHTQSIPGVSDWNPKRNKLLTIADHTFILDTGSTVGTKTVNVTNIPTGALVFVKQASYDTSYAVKINYTINNVSYGFTIGTHTAKNFSTGDTPPPTVSTKDIAQQLMDFLLAYEEFTSRFTVEKRGSTLYIKPKDAGSLKFSCEVSDSRGDTHITVAKDRVQKFAYLPSVAVRDFTVEIVGDESSAFDNYYVKFVPDDNLLNFGPGTWEETRKPEATRKLIDELTMPLALVHTNGSFALRWPTWAEREVGDEQSAPDPLFVGAKISDLFLYRNRLGFLSDDNLTLSAASDFYRFYPETVTTIVDSDPISLSAGHETVTNLKYAIPFQDNLVVFAENAQFNMPATDTLSPATAALKISTTYEADLSVKPVTTGETVAFCTRNGSYAGLREFYTDNDTLTRMSADITAHVPSFIPGNPVAMTCSTTENVLVVVSENAPNRLYVYKYYWSGSEKLQAAWFTYSLPKGSVILDAVFYESTLYLAVQRGSWPYLCSMDFSPAHLTENTDLSKIALHLDRQTQPLNGIHNATTDTTSWTNSGGFESTDNVCAVNRRTLKQVQCTVNGSVVTAPGMHEADPYVLGIPYLSKYTFSEQFLRATDDGGNKIATQLGRLQYRRWSIVYGPSCFFKVKTEQQGGGGVYEYPFTGQFVNRPLSFLARPALFKGTFGFPVKSVSDRVKISIENDTCLPCSFISAEWEAFYTQRQRGRY